MTRTTILATLATLATLLATVLLAATAHADARLFNPGATVVIFLDDGTGLVMHHVGHGKQTGPVRCYGLDDKLTVDKGNGANTLEGCYVEIDRNGKLHAPRPTHAWPLHHMAAMDSAMAIDDTGTTTRVSIDGVAGNAIGLFIDCADRRGDVRCRSTTDEDHNLSWHITFVVGKDGELE